MEPSATGCNTEFNSKQLSKNHIYKLKSLLDMDDFGHFYRNIVL